jgi:hypothetical protein
VSKASVKVYFAQSGRRNKYDIALAVAKCFPELAWQLPKRRKSWQSEAAAQVVFDAVAIAVVYFAASAKRRDLKSSSVGP